MELIFHLNGFALGLVLKQRQKATQKWPIELCLEEWGNSNQNNFCGRGRDIFWNNTIKRGGSMLKILKINEDRLLQGYGFQDTQTALFSLIIYLL